MVRLIIVRPGATEYEEQGRIRGTLDIPLSPSGSEQAQRAARELETLGIQIVYTSPCLAACETGTILSRRLDVRHKTVNLLRNLDLGLWQGKLVNDVKQKQPKVYRQWQDQPETVCPPDGEMISEARRRIQIALEKILKKHREGCVAIVVPDPLAGLVRFHVGHGEMAELWLVESEECGHWEQLEVGVLNSIA